jgi:diacylglycerol O-acyltransferase
MVRRLSGPDAFFLFTEGPSWPMHTGGLVVLDRSEAPDFSIEKVRDLIERRIHRVPIFTMKLKEIPLGLDRPLLVDDPDFKVEAHVHRIAVPPPGGPM